MRQYVRSAMNAGTVFAALAQGTRGLPLGGTGADDFVASASSMD
jgi:hypothetical protein